MIPTRKIYKTNRTRTGRRQGSVLLIGAGSMVVVMGFCALAIDYGMLVADANRLQRACDVAALAGARKLGLTGDATVDTQNAKAESVLIASKNLVTVDPNQITFPDGNTKIRVPATEVKNYFFARIIGFSSGTVTRHATVAAKKGVSTPDIAPIGITENFARTYAPNGVPLAGTGNRAIIDFVDHKKENFVDGRFILFDLRSASSGAKSPIHMQAQLEGREVIPIVVGSGVAGPENMDFVDALNANLNGSGSKFIEGMRTRFRAASGAPWFDVDPARPADIIHWSGQHYNQVMAGTESTNGAAPFTRNPRIMDMILTTPDTAGGGNTDQPVLDYAPVYVEQVTFNTNSVQLIVRFLPKSLAASGGSTRLVE